MIVSGWFFLFQVALMCSCCVKCSRLFEIVLVNLRLSILF